MALRSYLLKNSQFLRLQVSDRVQFPYFTLPSLPSSTLFKIDPTKTLRELSSEISSNFSSKEVSFYGTDGSKLSLSSSLLDSTIDPLNIKIGEDQMYTLYNLNVSQLHLAPHQRTLVQQYQKEKKLPREEAEIIGTFNSYILKEMQEFSESDITVESFNLMVKNAVLQYGTHVLAQKQLFETKLALIKSQYAYELEMHEEASIKAEIASKKAVKRFFYIIFMQFAAVQYGTYHLYSWDIMEPITCMMTMGDVCAGYLFWMIAGRREYGMDGIKAFFYQRKYKKLMNKKKITMDEIENLLKTISDIEQRIKST